MILPLNPADDAVRIHALFQAAYRIEADLICVETFPPLERSAEDIARSTTCFSGIFSDDVLAGVIEYMPEDADLSIDSLAVDPGFFRRGMARQLVSHLLGNTQWRAFTVHTAKVNEPAISLYESLGFVIVEGMTTGDGVEIVRLVLQP